MSDLTVYLFLVMAVLLPAAANMRNKRVGPLAWLLLVILVALGVAWMVVT